VDSSSDLPKFRRPPVIEVVHGMQFAVLPLTLVHPGLFYRLIRDRFPKSQTVPPLLPSVMPERASLEMLQAPPGLQFSQGDDVPRAWFISEDAASLVQLQTDRLLFNWRHEPSQTDYPHFDTMHAEFQKLYRELEKFASDENLGAIRPQTCEMTYINHIHPMADDAGPASISSVFRLWRDDFGPEWRQAADFVNWGARYLLKDHAGKVFARLTSNLTNLIQAPSAPLGGRILQLEISVHGFPSTPTFDGVSEFHNSAHQAIVKYFAGITTRSAHDQWERIQ
jgi:uncharacterized protein (TIGR04255 family)